MCREAGIVVIHASQVLRADGANMGVLGAVVPQVRDGIGLVVATEQFRSLSAAADGAEGREAGYEFTAFED